MPATARTPGRAPGTRRGRAAELAVCWEISPEALLVSRGAAMLNGHAAELASCSLVWTITGAEASAAIEMTLKGGEQDTLPLIDRTPVRRSENLGLVHLDAPDLFHATLRPATGGWLEVLFARTALLAERLGLPGGVYDAPTSRPRAAKRRKE